MAESSEIRSIQKDLRILQEWLATVNDGSNTHSLHTHLVEHLLKMDNPSEDSLVSGSILLPHLKGGGQPPDSIRHYAPPSTQKKWWNNHKTRYHRKARSEGADPLVLYEIKTKPLQFGYRIDPSDPGAVLEDTEIRYIRESVDVADLSFFGRLLYRQGRIDLKGWRRHTYLAKALTMSAWLAAMSTLTIIAFIFRPARDPWAFMNVIILGVMTWAFYRIAMVPMINFNITRMKMAHPLLMKFSDWQKPDMQWEIMRLEKDQQGKQIDLVRWHAECPICSAPVDVVDHDDRYKGIMVGRCRESIEHLFSFDRATGEGRALRARPKRD